MIQECHSFNIVFECIYYFDNAFENFMAFTFSEYQNNENRIKSIKDGEEATLNGEHSGVSEGNFFLSSQSLIIIIAFLVIVIAVLLYK